MVDIFPTESRKKLLLGSIKKMSSVIGGMLVLILSTRYLGPELRGQYMFILNSVSILSVIFLFGISSTIPYHARLQFRQITIDEFYSISIYQFFLGILVSGIILVGGYNRLFIICLMTSFSVLSTQLNNLSLVTDFKRNAIAYISSSIVNCLLMVLIYLSTEAKLIFVIALWILKEIVVLSILLYRAHFQLKKPRVQWIRLYKAALLPTLVIIMVDINYRIGVILLEKFGISDYDIGIYTLGISIAQYTLIISDVFKEVLLNENAKARNIPLTNRSLRFSFSILVLILFILILTGKWLLPCVFGDDFQKSYSVMILIMSAVPFMSHTKLIGVIFQVENLWKAYFWIMLIASSLNVITLTLLVKDIGYYSAAVGSMVSYAVSGLLCLLFYSKKYRQPFLRLFLVNKEDVKEISKVSVKRHKTPE